MTIIIMQIAVFIAIAWLMHNSALERQPQQIRARTEQTEKLWSATPGRQPIELSSEPVSSSADSSIGLSILPVGNTLD
jgi:hypothetical protein